MKNLIFLIPIFILILIGIAGASTPILNLTVPSNSIYNGVNRTVTASVYPTGITGNVIMYINNNVNGIDVASFNSTSNTITYASPATAGYYKFEVLTNANATYTSANLSKNFTISKVSPILNLSVCGNYNYNGSGCKVTASISSISNQITGDLYVNNAIEVTTNSIISYTTSPDAGNYIIKFNTSGDSNYTSNTISKSFTISKATPILSLTIPNNSIYNDSFRNIVYGLGSNSSESLNFSLYINGNVVNTFKSFIIYKTISGFDVSGGVAVSPNGSYAYVTNFGNNNLSIVNLTTDSIVKTISGFDNPEGVAVSPNGAYIYVINNGNGILNIINLTTDSIVNTISGFNSPEGVAVSPNGAYIYVVNSSNNNLIIINLTTDSIVNTISGFNSPEGVAVSPNGNYLYVVNSAVNTLSIVNLTTNSIVKTISGFYGPGGVAISQNGAYAYVTNDNDGTLSIVNLTANSIVRTISGSYSAYPTAVAISPNGAYAYFMDNNLNIVNLGIHNFRVRNAGTYNVEVYTAGNVNYNSANLTKSFTISKATPILNLTVPKNSTYNDSFKTITYGINNFGSLNLSLYINGNTINTFKSFSIYRNISEFYYPEDVAVSPNAAYAYVTNYNNKLSIVNLTTNSIVKNVSGFDYPLGVALSSNGAYTYVTNYNNSTLSIVNLTTNSIVRTISGFNDPDGVAVSSTGSYAYVSNYNNSILSIVNLTTNSIVNTISGFYYPEDVAVSQNGAYAYVTNYNNKLSIVNLTANSIVKNVSGFDYPLGVAISQNGAYAYVSNYNNGTLSIVNLMNNSIVKTISGFDGTFGVAVSPNGNYIYVTNFDKNTLSITNSGIHNFNVIDAGTYDVKLNTLGDSNYTSNTISKNFTISKATPILNLTVPSNSIYDDTNGTVTASVYPSGITGNVIMSIDNGTGVDIVSFTSISNTIKYTSPAIAGYYKFRVITNANSNYTSTNITRNFTILKAIPILSLGICGNYTYNGSGCKIIASISSISNQIIGDLYINNVSVGTTNSIINNVTPSKTGNYTIKFNTLGDSNYTPNIISKNFTILTAVSKVVSKPINQVNGETIGNELSLNVNRNEKSRFIFKSMGIQFELKPNQTTNIIIEINNLTSNKTYISTCYSSIYAIKYNINSSSQFTGNMTISYNNSYEGKISPFKCVNNKWEPINTDNYNYINNQIKLYNISNFDILGLLYKNYTSPVVKVPVKVNYTTTIKINNTEGNIYLNGLLINNTSELKFKNGTILNFKASPKSGYKLVKWEGTGINSYSGNATSFNITVMGNFTEVPIFSRITIPLIKYYSLVVKSNPVNGGTVYPNVTSEYKSGTSIFVKEIPNDGYTFINWTCLGDNCYSGNETSFNLTIIDNVTEIANYKSIIVPPVKKKPPDNLIYWYIIALVIVIILLIFLLFEIKKRKSRSIKKY